MNIKTIGHDFEHNLWLVVSLFFTDDEDVNIISTAHYINAVITVDTEIVYNNNKYTGSYSFPCNNSADPHIQRRICSAVCGMSFYNTVEKFHPKALPWGVMTGIRPAKLMRQMLAEGHLANDIFSYSKQLYGATDKKLSLALDVAQNELTILSQNSPEDIGLYIGIPFCPSRCLYCSFISSDLRYTKKYVADYCALLVGEMEHAANLIKSTNLRIQSIYIGGGTPTSLSEGELELLIANTLSLFDMSSLKEFCVEAGRPDTITKDKLSILHAMGVDRISINPQTMNECTLQTIGRAHSPSDIKTAFWLARNAGFTNINTDLIVGLPGEDEAMFSHTLDEISMLSPENITVHTMSVKRGSALNQHKGNFALSSGVTVENMLDIAHDYMYANGYVPYYMYRQKNMLGNLENVGYSKPGYMSVYNVNIMEEVQSILALGAGGSSKIVSADASRIERVFNFKSPIEYISRFDEILNKKDEFFALVKSV